ncbi:cation:proton antiporter [Nitratifractor sp.]
MSAVLAIALTILGYGLVSEWLSRRNVTGPMVFTALGVAFTFLLPDRVPHPHAESVRLLAELTLIVVLFSDAASIDLGTLRRHLRLPGRLLFAALPLSILLGWGAAVGLFPDQGLLYPLLLALILAPTDAALGKAVLSDRRIPESIRNALNVESGLNDGIVFPLFLGVLAFASRGHRPEGLLGELAAQILLVAVWGILAGLAGAYAVRFAKRRGTLGEDYARLIPLALAVAAYALAEHLGGNGYIAAFFGGLSFGNADPEARADTRAFAESEGELLILVSFLVFGLVFVPLALRWWDANALLYALLSLTIVRMVPVALVFGKGAPPSGDRILMGWFGPRGIASILYLLVAYEELGGFTGHERIFAAAALCVVLSVYLHGLSARPFATLYARFAKNTK